MEEGRTRKGQIHLPIDRAIISLSGLGVSFISSTSFRMGLRVLRAICEAGTSHVSRIARFFLGGSDDMMCGRYLEDINDSDCIWK